MTTEEKLKILAEAILTLNSEIVWLTEQLLEVDQVGLQNLNQIWEIANDSSV